MLNNLFLNILTFFISIVDYSNKKKILAFFGNQFKTEALIILDIGAHKGESIHFFMNNFNISKIFSFEPNQDLYLYLKNKFKDFDQKVELINLGVGNISEEKELNIMTESSSSTFNEIDQTSSYYKRKKKLFSFFFSGSKFLKKKQKIALENLSNIIKKKSINKIDILKIDTEGYEYNVIRGINDEDFKKIKFIYFEHHYDLMIKKGYKYSDINKILNNKGFKLKYKLKMRFRKSFEYIYEISEKNIS
tara:strand:+ start:1114 stop:1857 length:744 start_codon:yes stop_codon:yes gene_type:complete